MVGLILFACGEEEAQPISLGTYQEQRENMLLVYTKKQRENNHAKLLGQQTHLASIRKPSPVPVRT